jgi:cell division protein FtsL
MDSLKKRSGEVHSGQPTSSKPVHIARRHRQLRPFFFHMGPVSLTISSVLLIGLMAVLYLSQLGRAVTTNQQLQNLRSDQATLFRQNQDLAARIAQERSPQYVMNQATKMGLVPVDPGKVQVITIHGLQPIQNQNPNIQP